jgi:hypothetical protein
MLGVVLALALLTAGPVNHFHWPKEISNLDDEMVQVPIDKLPSEAKADLMDIDWGPDGNTNELYIDLNGDGTKELIVNDGTGGSGGPGYHIYQRSEGKWKIIAAFQGGITLSAKANGYYQLTVRSRGGGGVTGRDLFRFVRGKYRAVHSEEFKDGVLVRSLSQKELNSLSDR